MIKVLHFRGDGTEIVGIKPTGFLDVLEYTGRTGDLTLGQINQKTDYQIIYYFHGDALRGVTCSLQISLL
jgi:hypothetical protein